MEKYPAALISEKLNIPYLCSPTSEKIIHEKLKKPIVGVLHGIEYTPIVSLLISSERYKKVIHVTFVIDLQSPYTYICHNVLYAFTINATPEPKKDIQNILFRDSVLTVRRSSDTLCRNTNVLGKDFFTKTNCQLKYDYINDEVILSFPTK